MLVVLCMCISHALISVQRKQILLVSEMWQTLKPFFKTMLFLLVLLCWIAGVSMRSDILYLMCLLGCLIGTGSTSYLAFVRHSNKLRCTKRHPQGWKRSLCVSSQKRRFDVVTSLQNMQEMNKVNAFGACACSSVSIKHQRIHHLGVFHVPM
ncbi:hypothetical protein GOP47_0023181 [Adiantum capillus-veneris]|uniref:Uncharacterized protein n=1 Tax=Adiantum capillus-veneris TaxID=13818 RepID=A0A9D4U793_ADICA|nr:hypothetical protein GOP47_0023181 [Adiantum capillus-veneris]